MFKKILEGGCFPLYDCNNYKKSIIIGALITLIEEESEIRFFIKNRTAEE